MTNGFQEFDGHRIFLTLNSRAPTRREKFGVGAGCLPPCRHPTKGLNQAMPDSREAVKKDLEALVEEGERAHMLLTVRWVLEHPPPDFEVAENAKKEAEDFKFGPTYQRWYSRALRVVEQFFPTATTSSRRYTGRTGPQRAPRRDLHDQSVHREPLVRPRWCTGVRLTPGRNKPLR